MSIREEIAIQGARVLRKIVADNRWQDTPQAREMEDRLANGDYVGAEAAIRPLFYRPERPPLRRPIYFEEDQ